MKRHSTVVVLLLIAVLALSAHSTFAQLTGTKTIPGDYATITLAVADLNTLGVGAGGVTFNVSAGYTETLGSLTAGLITATGTASNPVVFQKSGVGANPVITAFSPGSSTTVDYIFCLAGGDYVTFDGIDLSENAGNTTASQQMEWGYSLVKKANAAPFDGCQNVTIKNCTITLNKANTASVGIYAGNHISTSTTSLTITAATDAMNNCKFFNNTITNCYGAIALSGFSASTPYALYDQNNEIGVGGANTITNFGGGSSSARAIYAIYQNGLKVNNNNINSAVTGSTTTVYGIFLSTGTSSSADVNGNTISLSFATGAYTSTVTGISNATGSTAASNTVNINNNIIQNCDFSGFSTGAFVGITNSATAATVNINSNTINNITIAGTSTSVYLIDIGSPVTGNANSNTITNITRTGASGTTYAIRTTSPTTLTVNSNTIDGINYTNTASTGTTYGFYSLSSAVNVTASTNIIRNFSTPATGSLYGIREFGVSGTKTFQNNQVYNFSTYAGGAGGGSFYGIYCSTGNNDISGNKVYTLNSTGTTGGTAGVIYGIYLSGGTTNSVYKNKIYDLSSASTNPGVYGVYLGGGTTNTVYNNLIGDLRTPAANAAIPLAGINVSGGTTGNVYFNTVNLNATSTGALFGSAALYASTSPTLNMSNNILVNTSTPAGATGYAVAYRRTSTTLTTYGSASNNNDFYAGTPGANNLIFFDGTNSDQTVAAYKTRVSPRDAASFSENPSFVSTVGSNAGFLHINTGISTQIESGASPIAGITDDYDADVRNVSTPDIGADEFAGIGIDLSPPNINYTALAPSFSAGNRTLDATITDATGVSGAGNAPRIYYKKGAAGSYVNANATTIVGSVYTFTIDHTTIGAAPGDTVFYYVAAQDIVGPSIGTNPAGGSGINPPGTTPPASPNSYKLLSPISSFPYAEGFESLTFPPEGWTNTGATLWVRGTESYAGAGCAKIIYSHTGNSTLTSPKVVLPSNHRITFWWKDDDITVANDRPSAKSSKDGVLSPQIILQDTTYFEVSSNGGTSWSTLTFLSAAAAQTTYSQVVQDLSSFAGNDVYFRFRDVSNGTLSAYGTGVDSIRIEPLPSGPPDCAALVGPTNAGTNVVITDSLRWAAASSGSSPTGYKLYFGTDNPPTNIVNGTNLGLVLKYVPASAMQYSTLYYWKVVPTNVSGDAAGCTVYSFTTQANPNYGGGGSGSGGYYFANSTPGGSGAPSQPVYSWYDPIALGHTQILDAAWLGGATSPGDDGYFGPVSIGFPFTYFGTAYTELYVGTNGLIRFGAPMYRAAYGPTTFPDAIDTNRNIVAVAWMDLDTRASVYPAAGVYYGGDASKFVITWRNIHDYGSTTDSITCQAVFFPNNNIKLQYNDALSTQPLPASINNDLIAGIEDVTGTLGIGYRVNGTGAPVYSSPVAVELGTNVNALPIQLSSFTAHLNQTGGVRIDWTTASETNNYGFLVQRRLSGSEAWSTVSNHIPGHGTTLEPHNYSFVDVSGTVPGTYQYRLRQLDLDGTAHHIDPISITVGVTSVTELAPREFSLKQNYPNPFNPETVIKFSVETSARTTLEVYNVLGQKVATLFNDLAEAGQYYNVRLNGTAFASGMYIYRLQSGTRIDVKKMLLLK